jgi:AraC family transcriptional regulator
MTGESKSRRQFLQYAGAAGLYASLEVPLLARETGAGLARGSRFFGASGPVKTITFPSEYVICLNHIGLYDQVNETWQRLSTFAVEKKITGHATRAIGIIYDDPTKSSAEKFCYDACLTVDRNTFMALHSQVDGRSGIRLETICGRETVSTVHRGPHATIGGAYELLLQSAALATSGSTDRVPPPYYEVYLNNPRFTRPAELLTEVHIPLPVPTREDKPE